MEDCSRLWVLRINIFDSQTISDKLLEHIDLGDVLLNVLSLMSSFVYFGLRPCNDYTSCAMNSRVAPGGICNPERSTGVVPRDDTVSVSVPLALSPSAVIQACSGADCRSPSCHPAAETVG